MRHAEETPSDAAGAFRPGVPRGIEGFFRVAPDDAGRWWLFDPEGAPFFARAVHGVRSAASQPDGALPLDTIGRLRTWGFNALGNSRESALREEGLPFLASVEFCSIGQPLIAPRLRLPDVFHPDWSKLAADRANEICTPLQDAHELLGWVTDDDLDWAPATSAGRPSLLQLCLSLEPSFPAYHAAWEFVLAHHGGRLESVAHAWNASIPNKEVIRELTRAEEGLGTRGYLRDEARWAREFARRYFTSTATAIRQADPHHLNFGCRFRRAAGQAVLTECMYPLVDASLPHWSELPAANSTPSQPVLANDVSFTSEDFLRSVFSRRTPRLTSVERMLRKARIALDRAARHPAVIGYTWAQWQDDPSEQPPFAGGLVHVNGSEAREHTELLQQFNARAETLHRASAGSSEF